MVREDVRKVFIEAHTFQGYNFLLDDGNGIAQIVFTTAIFILSTELVMSPTATFLLVGTVR